MDRHERPVAPMSKVRRAAYLGLVSVVLVLLAGPVRADEPWTGGSQFGLLEPTEGPAAGSATGQGVVAALAPGSVLLAQAGGSVTGGAPSGWQFTIGPYLWTPRTEIDLTLGSLTRSTTIDFFSDVTDHLNIGFTGHFEANWREWTALLDLLYMKLGKDETTGPGIQTELDFQLLLFEFGGTYRLATLPVGRTGRLTLEALAGGRLMYVDAELTVGGQSRSRSTTLIDPMFGGRIAYHITDTVAALVPGGRGRVRDLGQPERAYVQPHRGAELALHPSGGRLCRMALHARRYREGHGPRHARHGRVVQRAIHRRQLLFLRAMRRGGGRGPPRRRRGASGASVAKPLFHRPAGAVRL